MQETVIFDNMLTKVVIMGIPEKIKAIEDEIHKTQINKATEFHIGLLKAKIARLKREMEENTHGKVISAGGALSGFDVKRTGNGTRSAHRTSKCRKVDPAK